MIMLGKSLLFTCALVYPSSQNLAIRHIAHLKDSLYRLENCEFDALPLFSETLDSTMLGKPGSPNPNARLVKASGIGYFSRCVASILPIHSKQHKHQLNHNFARAARSCCIQRANAIQKMKRTPQRRWDSDAYTSGTYAYNDTFRSQLLKNMNSARKEARKEARNQDRSGKSFGNRAEFISESDRDALLRLMPRWALPFQSHTMDLPEAFGRQAPTILEIGFGMGEAIAQTAEARPQDNFLGIEVRDAGIAALLLQIEKRNLTNIRVIQHDAVEVLQDMIKNDSLAGIHVYFPNTWPRKRHRHRRLIQAPFVSALATRIAPGGYLHCATGWEPYAQQMLEVLSAEPLLSNTAESFSPRPEFRPVTNFEIRALNRELATSGVWDLIFKRRG
eukprot:gnl/MRDRNA2_/MRDRNA2_142326_c0_seq1.p1 gnl/MRDRNA2_/MRDRNA2_142326_c0~~gnl/MRDRNA2_/MRDRNA2_142326_c0_seq1.p1  ORF type:complete len:390 (-),score=41.79 gnl/MRDRNA2_/MRDRNA2_142326_c0_seq1:72-1241(-)